MYKLIDGKQISDKVRQRLKLEVEELSQKGAKPGLAVIIVGNDNASKVYVRNKHIACEELGIYSEIYELPEETNQKELLDIIDVLNERDNIHGILVQLPLPKSIDENEVIKRILPKKDVDAFSEENVGKIMIGDYAYLPCTPAGIMTLLNEEGIDVSGKHCVVVGRSNIVGKPMAMLMLHSDATVTICHSKTKNLKEICKNADILVAAVGKEKFITEDMVKENAIVIDAGMNRDENNKLCGDVDFDNVKEKTAYITPVPGGVGPMTITTLMQNTITAARKTL